MTDDRSLERAARSWLELGPTEAPDYAVDAALLVIQTTTQERDWHVQLPRRFRPMTLPARFVTAAIAIALVAVGGIVILRPGPNVGTGPSSAPSATRSAPPPSPASASPSLDPGAQLDQYREARNAICNAGNVAKAPLQQRWNLLYVPHIPPDVEADGVNALREYVTLADGIADQLDALQPPEAIRDEVLAHNREGRDLVLLVRQAIKSWDDGNAAGALAIDASTDVLSAELSSWGVRYGFVDCP